jgi:hypothetical protein
VHAALVAQLTSIDEDILRLERALPGMRYYGPGHAATRQSAPHLGSRSKPGPKPYNPLSRRTQMYAWDIRGHRPLPLVPVRHGASIGQPAGRRSSRELGSPISAVLQAGHMRPATPNEGSSEKPRALPKLVIVGERQMIPGGGHAVSRANVPRAVTPADKAHYGFPQGMARTKGSIWAASDTSHPLTMMPRASGANLSRR